MKKLQKSRVLLIGFTLLALLGAALFYYYKAQTTWVESPPYTRDRTEPASILVVVYSRTGNTFGAAKEIARYFNADLLQIKAPQYPRTIEGNMRASTDADNEVTTVPIQHDVVDLSRYDLIVLSSPTWWFRPAPPLWSFVENHDFLDKPVFLMMTGNSRYKEIYIDKFSSLVNEKNGNFLDMLFIRRGRIYWQKTPHQVNQEIQEALDNRKTLWDFKNLND